MPHLGPLTSEDQTLVLAGLAFSPSSGELKGHHHQVMVTFYVCSRKAPWPMNVNSCSEVLPHQDVINLVVMFPIWALPCPSGWFVKTKDVCQN